MDIRRKLVEFVKKRFKIYSLTEFINRNKRRLEKKYYRNQYSTEQLSSLLREMGLKEGTCVLVHSSWNDFYNYTGTVEEFIDAILEIIGKTGTLVMPAYPFLRKPESVFDLNTTPTSAGIIAETFRNYPGVKRSINMHSVCSLGPLSDYLLNEHHLSTTSWDEKSPYYKLSKVNAVVLSIGLGKYFIGTIMHCANSILRTESAYYSLFFQKEKVYKYRLNDHSIFHQTCLTASDDFNYFFTDRSINKVINRYFNKEKYNKRRLSNLNINIYDAEYFINRAVELGEQGITLYLKPNPKHYFRK